MDIDLSLLHSNTVPEIVIDGYYKLSDDYYKNTEIKNLSKIKVNGKITRKENADFELADYVECTISGDMLIPDSISLKDVTYQFTSEYNDFLSENSLKNENLLDILAFLWENIVLEIPLQFTEEEDFCKYQGNGWRLISEEELNKENNPFNDLLKDFEKE